MGKVNLLVKYRLINQEMEYNIKGIFLNNQIKYLQKDNLMIIDKTKLTFQRKTEDSLITFDFKKELCKFLDKETNYQVNFKIKVVTLINQLGYFKVSYKINDDLFEIAITIKE